ncbi:MAG: hypothetical protein ABW046_14720 [Actinoplanes sp.]
MRWLGLGKRRDAPDPGRSNALLQDIRLRFPGQPGVPFADQAAAVATALAGDEGLATAALILREFADAAQAEMYAQVNELHRRTGRGFAPDRRNYRPLWQSFGPELNWTLFTLPVGLHPYIHVAAAVTVLSTQARQAVRVIAPEPVVAHVFELLDLVLVGWEFGRVRIDADGATLADGLIVAGRELNAAMSNPPPLPEPVRELMRRNNTVDVYDPAANRILGVFNPGKAMREALLA